MSIEIKDVVALTGSPGLYCIVKSDDHAVIVESMDARRKRQLIKGSMLLSKLTDISIYTDEDSTPLVHVLKAVQEKFGSDLPVTKKSSKDDLMDFLAEVLPTFDRERVYPSNVKKLLSWYKILSDYGIAFELEQAEEEQTKETEAGTEASEEASQEETQAEDTAAEIEASEEVKQEDTEKGETTAL